MGIIYNEDTAVSPNFKITNKSNYSYLSENNIEQTEQNENVSYYRSSDGTVTVTEDFVLTDINGSVNCGDNAGLGAASVSISYKGNTIYRLGVSSEVGESASQASNAKFPNWKIKKGDTFAYSITNTHGSASASIIGYKI